jgi:hypothetical protein
MTASVPYLAGLVSRSAGPGTLRPPRPLFASGTPMSGFERSWPAAVEAAADRADAPQAGSAAPALGRRPATPADRIVAGSTAELSPTPVGGRIEAARAGPAAPSAPDGPRLEPPRPHDAGVPAPAGAILAAVDAAATARPDTAAHGEPIPHRVSESAPPPASAHTPWPRTEPAPDGLLPAFAPLPGRRAATGSPPAEDRPASDTHHPAPEGDDRRGPSPVSLLARARDTDEPVRRPLAEPQDPPVARRGFASATLAPRAEPPDTAAPASSRAPVSIGSIEVTVLPAPAPAPAPQVAPAQPRHPAGRAATAEAAGDRLLDGRRRWYGIAQA